MPWFSFHGVTSWRLLNCEWFDSRPSTWTPALSKTLLSMSPVRAPNVLQAAQDLQRNQASKPEATGRLCLPLSQKPVPYITPRTSLLHTRSPLHSNHRRFCTCSPHTRWEKAFGKHSSIIEKVLKYSYENSCLFCFPCSFIYIHFQQGKKFLEESLHYRKRTKTSELEMQPEQVHVALPNSFPSSPAPFSFDVAVRPFS